MKKFYRELSPFEICGESDTGLSFRPGNTLFSLRQRTRDYDGRGPRLDAPSLRRTGSPLQHFVQEGVGDFTLSLLEPVS